MFSVTKKNRRPRCEEGRLLKLNHPSTKLFSLQSSEISVLQLSNGESYWNGTSEEATRKSGRFRTPQA
jgi:hypothetical protein